MKYVYNRITLDVDDMTSQVSISLKRGDSARGLIVTLVKDGKIFEIGDECYAVFSAKQDGGAFVSDGCTVKDNKIVYEYSDEFIYLSGKIDCDITVYDSEDKKLVSPSFSAFFFGSIMEEYADEVVNSDSFATLNALVEEATNVIAQVEQTEYNVSSEEAKRVTAESERKTAESERKSEEVARNQRVAQITSDLENGNIVAKNATNATNANNWTSREQFFTSTKTMLYNSEIGKVVLPSKGYYYLQLKTPLGNSLVSFGIVYWDGIGSSVSAASRMVGDFDNVTYNFCLKIKNDGSYVLLRYYDTVEETDVSVSDFSDSLSYKVYFTKVW